MNDHPSTSSVIHRFQKMRLNLRPSSSNQQIPNISNPEGPQWTPTGPARGLKSTQHVHPRRPSAPQAWPARTTFCNPTCSASSPLCARPARPVRGEPFFARPTIRQRNSPRSQLPCCSNCSKSAVHRSPRRPIRCNFAVGEAPRSKLQFDCLPSDRELFFLRLVKCKFGVVFSGKISCSCARISDILGASNAEQCGVRGASSSGRRGRRRHWVRLERWLAICDDNSAKRW